MTNTDRTDIEEFIVDERHIGFRVVYSGFARQLERELILATKDDLSGNSVDNSQYVANYQRAACGVDSSADSAKPQGSQVASPAVAHPIAAVANSAAHDNKGNVK